MWQRDVQNVEWNTDGEIPYEINFPKTRTHRQSRACLPCILLGWKIIGFYAVSHGDSWKPPRFAAELLDEEDSQIKSCLADKWNRIDFRYWEACITQLHYRPGRAAEFSFSTIAECTRPSLHAICNNNPRSVHWLSLSLSLSLALFLFLILLFPLFCPALCLPALSPPRTPILHFP